MVRGQGEENDFRDSIKLLDIYHGRSHGIRVSGKEEDMEAAQPPVPAGKSRSFYGVFILMLSVEFSLQNKPSIAQLFALAEDILLLF